MSNQFIVSNPEVDFEVVDGGLEGEFDGLGDAAFDTFNISLLGTTGEARNLVEFDISNFVVPEEDEITQAFVEVRLTSFAVSGLGVFENPSRNPDNLGIFGYQGNGIAEAEDFQRADTFLSSVNLSSVEVGDILTFDVTEFVQTLYDDNADFAGFGIRALELGGVAIEEGQNFPRLVIKTDSITPNIIEGNDQANNLIGTNSADEIRGFDGRDTLNGGEGNDTLLGGDGQDILFGGNDQDSLVGDQADDTLNGGLGNDTLYGGLGKDVLNGENGEDTLFGGFGRDSLIGGLGNDSLVGDQGEDTLDGGDSNDILSGGNGKDLLAGGNGEDSLFGDQGEDTLNGGNGKDTLLGGNDKDTLFGENSNDILFGGNGQDSLVGGSGNDTLDGGLGNDILTGGDGIDLFILRVGDGKDVINDFQLGIDRLGLADGIQFQNLTLQDNTIKLGDELLVTLNNLDAENLSTSDIEIL